LRNIRFSILNFKPDEEYVDILPGNENLLVDEDDELLEEELNQMIDYDEEGKIKEVEKEFHKNMDLVE